MWYQICGIIYVLKGEWTLKWKWTMDKIYGNKSMGTDPTKPVSVGTRKGTPKIALPIYGECGKERRYARGKVTVD